MAVEIQGKVGPVYAADASLIDPRFTRDGGIVTQDLHGRFYESVMRGQVYEACTAVTGVAPGTTIGTTASFTLYNPIGSGKNISVIDCSVGYISGTLGSGTVFLCANTNPTSAAVTGTAIVPVNLFLGGPAGVAKPFTTATLPVAPTVLRPVWTFTAMLATSALSPVTVREVLDGKCVITPGCAISFLGVMGAAGTSPLVSFAMSWEEITP